jgi:glycosyltransferase involved in cell wall biosynthesis
VSLTFIQREVRALRQLGVRIDTFAIRRAFPEHLRAAVDQEEFKSTFTVLPPRPVRLLTAHLTALLVRPRRYLATLALALRLRPRGLRGMVWQCFYFVEAVVIWRECDRRRIRHIHAHFANVATDVALLATHFAGGDSAGWSWSFTLHGSVEFFDVHQSRLAEKLSRARFVVCISDFARSQAMAFLDHGQWGKLHVVHCGVDPDEFHAVDRSRRRDAVHILSVGRLIEAKGQPLLLEAFARLRKRGVKVRLTLIGDGPKQHALESLAVRLGVHDAIRFLGAVGQDEVAAFYRAADLFCLSSFAEGVPVVLMEAMAMQTAVVATRVAGVPELVEDGVSGLLVRPGRCDQLASALETLSIDPNLREALGEAARRKVACEFNIRRSAAELERIFARALAQRAAPLRRDGGGALGAGISEASPAARKASRALAR